jgi:predicted adenylyl cyclase CyaB
MENIEVEVRSFITKDEHDRLLKYFKKNAIFVKEDYQETFYFDCEEDLRIQKNNFYAKIWLKKGNIHDDHREEIEIKTETVEFDKMEQLFLSLGYDVEIKWFRKRIQFNWDEIKVCIDYTRGYGYIIELEQMSTEEKKEEVFVILKNKLESLDIIISPKEKFKERFEYYKKNWRELTKE